MHTYYSPSIIILISSRGRYENSLKPESERKSKQKPFKCPKCGTQYASIYYEAAKNHMKNGVCIVQKIQKHWRPRSLQNLYFVKG